MKYKLNTSAEAGQILKNISSSFNFNANVYCRYAIALSLNSSEELKFDYDSKGTEFQRFTLTGEYDLLIRELIKQKEGKFLDDDLYFTKYLKAHLERGIRLLEKEISLNGSFDSFISDRLNNGGTM
jgi:DNA sulfur modification protein DndE